MPVLLAGLLVSSGDTLAQQPDMHDGMKTFCDGLARKGFIVQRGLLDFQPIVDMCCQCQVPSCFANNPSSPYGIYVLPPAPNQDSSVSNPYTEWFLEDGTYPEGWSWFWRLRPDEAVVFIGITPPRMKYFGFTPYLYDRYHSGITPPPCVAEGFPPREAPPSALDRLPLFASLGDTVNHMTVHTQGDPNDPFSKDVIFILTADMRIDAEVRHALTEAGYRRSTFNTVVIPADIAQLGVENDKDSISLLLRMASDEDLSDYTRAPGVLLRVSPAQPVRPSDLVPFEPPKLRVRGTGRTETALLPAVNALGRSIVAAYPGYDATPIITTNWTEGYNCIENSQNCMGDNRDTPYIEPSFNPVSASLNQDLVLRPGEFLVAYGVNHAATRKAVYSSIAVLGWAHKASPAVIDNDEMTGSARYFVGSSLDRATTDKLYAWKITRPGGCTKGDTPFCREIDFTCTKGVAADEPLAFIFRAYLERGTRVGPTYSEIIIDRMIKFTPKK